MTDDAVLHCAAQENWWELIEYLMTLDEIDPYVRNKAGDTVPGCAMKNGDGIKILSMLESKLVRSLSAKRDRQRHSFNMSMEAEAKVTKRQRSRGRGHALVDAWPQLATTTPMFEHELM
mmetsp:Transcript_9824/g.26784  ORF Transcript_9824/g.26784 Transcript_9824/m.26784 type:complete len:119 (+) Transcript_9824:468-824(+)